MTPMEFVNTVLDNFPHSHAILIRRRLFESLFTDLDLIAETNTVYFDRHLRVYILNILLIPVDNDMIDEEYKYINFC